MSILPTNYSITIESDNFATCTHEWAKEGTCEWHLNKVPVKQTVKKCEFCESVIESEVTNVN